MNKSSSIINSMIKAWTLLLCFYGWYGLLFNPTVFDTLVELDRITFYVAVNIAALVIFDEREKRG